MPQQQQGSWTPIEDGKRAFTGLAIISQAVAHPVEVILRTQFGSNYFGIPALIAFFALPMWMVFFPEGDPTGITVFWLFYLLMQLRARIEMVRRGANGLRDHSRYNGYPRLAYLFKNLHETKIKGVAEPLAVFLAALAVSPLSPPLSSYLIAAALALAFNGALIDAVQKARARELNDAWIEQQQLAERFRAMRGDDFD